MMVADTSALMAVLMDEQEHQDFLDAMLNDGGYDATATSAVQGRRFRADRYSVGGVAQGPKRNWPECTLSIVGD